MNIEIQYNIFKILSGGVFFMFVYHFTQFVVYKEKTYLYYAFHLFFIAINFFLIADLFDFEKVNEHKAFFLETTYILSFIFYNLFIYSQLNINLEPKIKKNYLSFVALLFLYLIGIAFFYPITDFKVVDNNIIAGISIRIVLLLFSFYLLYLLFKRYTTSIYKYLLIGTFVMVGSYAVHVAINLLYGVHLRNHFFNLTGTLIEILLFTYALNLKKRNAEIEKELAIETSMLKSDFFANISHEFRTPLTLIKSPVQSLQKTLLKEEDKKQLHLLENNANRMLELVDQLLELSKIDNGKLQIILKKGNLLSFFETLLEPYLYKAKEEHLVVNTSLQNIDEVIYFDRDILTKITTNLIDNAFKYNDDSKPIDFSVTVKNKHLIISVSNFSSQLNETDLKKLFERFHQKDHTITGFGIGLALVKDLVDLYEGHITIDYKNERINFTVQLPLDKELHHAVIIEHEPHGFIQNTDAVDTETDLPLLLIVDDNSHIRDVLKDLFKDQFQILEASNGKEGLKLAQKEIPDAILSDVMMPEMDGFEFTKAIKNNELTSFIPVILVTANTTDENHLKALKNTADAFITKPFRHDILKATVWQEIHERQKLQKRYSQELILKPVDIVINSVDEQFLQKLQHIVETQIGNADFKAEEFAAQLNMSRMQLHRKLKSLLGVSASEFMRNERLKNAAHLLQKGNGNISEIAYSVGFNDVSYFSKCFREFFKCTPTEYIEKNISS